MKRFFSGEPNRRYIRYQDGRFTSHFHPQSSYPRLYVSQEEPPMSSPYAQSVSSAHQRSSPRSKWFPQRVELIQTPDKTQEQETKLASGGKLATLSQTYVREDWYEKMMYAYAVLLILGILGVGVWYRVQFEQLPDTRAAIPLHLNELISITSRDEQSVSQQDLSLGQQRVDLLTMTQIQQSIMVQYEALKQQLWNESLGVGAFSAEPISDTLTLLASGLSSDGPESYQLWTEATTARLTHFQAVIDTIGSLPTLEAQVAYFNEQLSADATLQGQQIAALKAYLDENGLDYEEKEGQLLFELP